MATDNNNKPSPTANFPLSAKDFNSKEARNTNLLIDYYEGEQKQHLIDILNGKGDNARAWKGWKQRGIVPRVRNITKSIVDKSGLLFNRAPKLGVQLPTEINAQSDPTLNAILEASDWLEAFINLDVLTRLTKSTILLLQKIVPEDTITINGQYKFDAKNGDALIFDILHQGNSVVKMNPQRTKITALAFLTDWKNDALVSAARTDTASVDKWSYRLITPEEIIDVMVTSTTGTSLQDYEETIVSREANLDGLVPATFFYDVNKPRIGYWAKVPEDLRSLQEMMNLHITDMENAMAWAKAKSVVVTNGKITNNDPNNGDQLIPAAQMGKTPAGAVYDDIAAFQTKSIASIGGLGSVIQVTGDEQGAAKLEWLGPDTDLQKIQNVMAAMVEDVANDWDVNLKFAGGGSATSGFQLVVEEMNNLNLREKRAQSMVGGFRRFYEVLKQLYPNQLLDGMLQAEFAPPNLPVNKEEQERIWSDKIDNNRASHVDYFMEIHGMTEEQAKAKVLKVIDENNIVNAAIIPPPAPVTATETAADATLKPVRQDQNNG